MSHLIKALSTTSAVTAGLIAGTFFIFSIVIMPVLAKGTPEHGTQTMRAINEVILRSPFMFAFLAPALLSIALPILTGRSPSLAWNIAAGAIYLIGVFGVTIVANVPLNEGLDKGTVVWADYIQPWTLWNHVRTAASTAAMTIWILNRP